MIESQHSANDAHERPTRPSRGEFIAMMASLFAIMALSIDAMLPALPAIAAELAPQDVNRAQLVVTSFVLGMGLGTLLSGPLSDSIGRKPVIIGGGVLYVLASLFGWWADTLEMLLLARLFQGLGASGPRVVGIAIVRDLYAGREMARIMSFVMTVFVLVPALAPLLGAAVMMVAGWRAIFLLFVAFALGITAWVTLRQPETLPPARRRPFRLGPILRAAREVVTTRSSLLATLAATMVFGMLFSVLSTAQQIIGEAFGKGESFPLWFTVLALGAGASGLVNSRLVMRHGMRKVASRALAAQWALSLFTLAAFLLWGMEATFAFPLYMTWAMSVFFMVGLAGGNLNALALEPLGHIAGTASTVVSAFSTGMSVMIAIPTGLAYDGTPLPVIFSVTMAGTIALATMLFLARLGRAAQGLTAEGRPRRIDR